MKALVDFFSRQPYPLAYLFGSRARGDDAPTSDIDVAILTRRGDKPLDTARLAHEIGRLVGSSKVDVVSLDRAPVELQFRVIKEGRLLFAASEAERVEFEAGVLGRYYDFFPTLLRQRADLVQGSNRERRVQRYRTALGQTLRVLGEARAAAKQKPR